MRQLDVAWAFSKYQVSVPILPQAIQSVRPPLKRSSPERRKWFEISIYHLLPGSNTPQMATSRSSSFNTLVFSVRSVNIGHEPAIRHILALANNPQYFLWSLLDSSPVCLFATAQLSWKTTPRSTPPWTTKVEFLNPSAKRGPALSSASHKSNLATTPPSRCCSIWNGPVI